MKSICINCSPLVNNITGIERCIYENIKRFDYLASDYGLNIKLLFPNGENLHWPKIHNLEKVALPGNNGKIHVRAIQKYIKDNNSIYVSIHGGLCVYPQAIVCINDMRTWLHKEYDPLRFRLKCNINALSIKHYAGEIVTISYTMQDEISRSLGIPKKKIGVISPGWDHIIKVVPDTRVWEKIPLAEKGEYFYSLSSRAPHKNFKWVEEVAKRNPDSIFLIGGKKWTESGINEMVPPNLIYLGYVTDEENVELMRNCKAFIHPSKYEGFGITPLEALGAGAKVCVANASSMPEILGDAVHYFDPDNYDIDLNVLLSQPVGSSKNVLDKYTWEKSAKEWCSIMKKHSLI